MAKITPAYTKKDVIIQDVSVGRTNDVAREAIKIAIQRAKHRTYTVYDILKVLPKDAQETFWHSWVVACEHNGYHSGKGCKGRDIKWLQPLEMMFITVIGDYSEFYSTPLSQYDVWHMTGMTLCISSMIEKMRGTTHRELTIQHLLAMVVYCDLMACHYPYPVSALSPRINGITCRAWDDFRDWITYNGHTLKSIE